MRSPARGGLPPGLSSRLTGLAGACERIRSQFPRRLRLGPRQHRRRQPVRDRRKHRRGGIHDAGFGRPMDRSRKRRCRWSTRRRDRRSLVEIGCRFRGREDSRLRWRRQEPARDFGPDPGTAVDCRALFPASARRGPGRRPRDRRVGRSQHGWCDPGLGLRPGQRLPPVVRECGTWRERLSFGGCSESGSGRHTPGRGLRYSIRVCVRFLASMAC